MQFFGAHSNILDYINEDIISDKDRMRNVLMKDNPFKVCYNIKRILVTVDWNHVRHLVNKYSDYLIVNFDALTYAGNLENLKDEGKYVFVRRYNIQETFEQYQITDVIHLAAESHVDRSILNPVFVKTNVLGTLNLLNAARLIG